MRKHILSLFILLIISWINITGARGQVTTNSGSGLAASYPDLASAITALNVVGTATSPTIITVTGNEIAPSGGYSITATGTAVNTITIQGDIPARTLTAFNPQTSGNLNDAIIKIVGGDYITIQSFTMQENALNTTTAVATNNMTEFGIALLYATATNGAQNNTIQNNIISLNRTYSNTFGIYSNTRHAPNAILNGTTVSANPTSAAGTNANNKVYTNTISNVNFGIVFIGGGTTTAIDLGNDIGGSSAGTGNTITNWGSNAGATGATFLSLTTSNYCIFSFGQANDNISYNTITSAALTSSITQGGILKNYLGTAQPTSTITTSINNNTVTVTNNSSATTTGSIIGINNQGLTPLLSTATMSMNNNTVQNCVLGGATSTTNGLTGITNLSLAGTINITGNSIISNAITATTATSGLINGISNSGACGTLNVTNNIIRGHASTSTSGQVQGITNSGAVVTAINITNNQLGNTTSGFFSTSTVTSGTLFGISTSGGAATCALSITGNDIRGITYNTASSAAQTYYQNTATTLSQNISSNTFTNLNVNTTGNVTFIANAVSLTATGTMNINSNSIVTAFNKGGAGGTITVFSSNASSATGSVVNMTNNNFSNISVTGATGFTGINNTDGGSPTKTITGNSFNNISGGSGTLNPMTIDYLGATSSISTNTITNITWTGSIVALTVGGNSTATILNISGNTITGLSAIGIGGTVTGISNSSPSTTTNINGNTINTLSSTSTTATVAGITTSASANVFSNVINTLSCVGTTSGVTNGIMVTGGTTHNVYKNKIYDLTTSGAFTTVPGVNGIVLSGATTGVTANVYNNLIGDLKAPLANSVNAIRALSINATGTTSTNNVYYNTVFINATSAGANFGTTGIYHASSATATTNALVLRNNIIVNTSTANGIGFTVAHRRFDLNLANFSASSNNNLFFAGTPSTSNLIFYDATNSDQTLAAYKTRMATRDQASVSELPTWQSVAGTNANFLKYSTSVASLADNAAVAIGGYTDDFDGTTRSVTTPDMGAWELIIAPLLTIADNGTQPAAGNVSQGSVNNILQTFTITEGNRANATLNTVTIPTGANYQASDIQNLGLKLWRNTTNDFSTATAFTGVNATASGSGETISFSSLAFVITKNTTIYFWVTADISATATANNTINANSLAPANFTFALGTPTGTVSAGGVQTIIAVTPTVTLANNSYTGNIARGNTNVVLYRVDLTVALTSAILNVATFNTSGTYTAADVSNYKLWYHTNANFTTGTPTLIGTLAASGTGTKTFTGLTQSYPVGTNYLFLTTDMPCNAVVGNTITVDAIANGNFTFASGTPTGTSYTNSTITIDPNTSANNATSLGTTPAITSVALAWTAPTSCYDEVMVVVSPAANTGGTPTGDGTAYTANLTYNTGTAFGNGFVTYKGIVPPQTITGLASGTTYFFKIFTRNGTAWSSGIEVSATTNSYCAPSYVTGCAADYINNVTFNTISNLGTGCTGTATSYLTTYPASGSTTTTVERGVSYTLTLRAGGDTEGFGTWIDYNQDGDFLDAGEFVAVSTVANINTDQIFTVVIPLTANLGLTKMRVRCFYNRTSSTIIQSTACGALNDWGEAEDYTITIAPAPACNFPTALNVTALATTTATLNWTASVSNPANGYQWEVRTSGAGGSGVVGLVTSGSVGAGVITSSITGLTANTTYTFYVRSDCGGTFSTWASSSTFTTLCDAVNVPYTQDFESVTVPAIPVCTQVLQAGAGNLWATNSPAAYGFTTKALMYLYNSTNPANTWYFTQGINLTAGTSYRISYKYGNSSGLTFVERLRVAYGTNTTVAAMTNTIANYPNIVNDVAITETLDFTPASTGVFYIGFQAYSITDQDALFIDDISVIVTPTCFTPTAFNASVLTSTNATLNWTASVPAPVNGYQWEVRTSGAAGSGAVGLTASGAVGAGIVTTNVTGLTANTAYTLYVRADCAGSGFSAWNIGFAFTTPCNNYSLNVTEGFNAVTIPACWSRQFVSGTRDFQYTASAGTSPTITPQEGTQAIVWESFSGSGDQTRLVSPPITTTGVASVDAEFQWYFSVTGGVGSYLTEGVQVQYSTNGTTWINAGSLIRRYGATTGWALQSVTLPAGAGNQPIVYVGFLLTSNAGYTSGMDAIVIKPSVPKVVSAVTVTQASVATVGAGNTNQAILGVQINVTGSLGTLPLNSIKITAQNTADTDVTNVKLYRTTINTFATTNPIGTSQTLFGGEASFSSLGYDLPNGNTFIWVTYDIAAGATAGNTVDARILANQINVNGITYNAGIENPAGSRTINNQAATVSGNTTGVNCTYNRNALNTGTDCTTTFSPSGIGTAVTYQVIKLNTNTTGTHSIGIAVGSIPNMVVGLYCTAFNPSVPATNFFTSGFTSASTTVSGLALATGTDYYLVVSGNGNTEFGTYSVTFTGPVGSSVTAIPFAHFASSSVGTPAFWDGNTANTPRKLVLNGSVNPNGMIGLATDIEYATNATFTGSTIVPIGSYSGTTSQNINTVLSGASVIPGNIYYYRVRVPNLCGGFVYSAVQSYTVPLPEQAQWRMLNFSGAQNVTVPRMIQNALEPFTIEFWFKTPNNGTTGATNWTQGTGLIDVATAIGKADFGISISDGKIFAGTRDVAGTVYNITSTGTYADDKWHHVAFRRSAGSVLSLFIDGLNADNITPDPTIPNEILNASSTITIGSKYDGSNKFTGILDEIRFWNAGVNINRIREYMHIELLGKINGNTYNAHPQASNLQAYYQLNDASGNFASDIAPAINASAKGNTATLNGFTTGFWQTYTTPIGKVGYTSGEKAIGASGSGGAEIVYSPTDYTGVLIDFKSGGQAVDGDLHITMVMHNPESLPSAGVGAGYTSAYWIIHNFGNVNAALDIDELTFKLPSRDVISATDEATPSNLQLYKRADNESGAGSWAPIVGATSADNTAKTIQFLSSGGGTIDGFSQIIIASQTSPLPVRLVSFAGTRINVKENKLQWITATEENNRGFEIEKSTNGQTFTKIGFVEGAGNSATTRNYSFIDENATASAYYRLRQIEINNDKFVHSNIIFIDADGTASTVVLYPNPTQGKVNLQISDDLKQLANIRTFITDIKGIKVFEYTGNWQNTENLLNKEVPQLSNGTYIVRIITEKRTFTTKLVKE